MYYVYDEKVCSFQVKKSHIHLVENQYENLYCANIATKITSYISFFRCAMRINHNKDTHHHKHTEIINKYKKNKNRDTEFQNEIYVCMYVVSLSSHIRTFFSILYRCNVDWIAFFSYSCIPSIQTYITYV